MWTWRILLRSRIKRWSAIVVWTSRMWLAMMSRWTCRMMDLIMAHWTEASRRKCWVRTNRSLRVNNIHSRCKATSHHRRATSTTTHPSQERRPFRLRNLLIRVWTARTLVSADLINSKKRRSNQHLRSQRIKTHFGTTTRESSMRTCNAEWMMRSRGALKRSIRDNSNVKMRKASRE